ncbi:hypothetical protein NMG60_11001476 [Bertholletia excelsa]
MLPKKICSIRKLVKKVKTMGKIKPKALGCKYFAEDCDQELYPAAMLAGFFPVYVGEERARFLVPIKYLSHPLFRMLLDKAHDVFGYEQRNGLAVPCSAAAFQEVVAAVEAGRGMFQFGRLVEDFI